jgi:hypothetical protein
MVFGNKAICHLSSFMPNPITYNQEISEHLMCW